MTDRELINTYPSIPWTEPLPIRVLGTEVSGLGCRLCIAKNGLHAKNVGDLPRTREEFETHMKKEHA